MKTTGDCGLNNRGQSILEYVILMIILIAAIAGLRTYVLYALQGQLNETRMTLLEQASPYDPAHKPTGVWRHDYTVALEYNSAQRIEAPVTNSQDPLDDAIGHRSIESTSDTLFQEQTGVLQAGQ